MKKTNNYNTSTFENDIEINCCYDQGLALQWFEDFKDYGISDELNRVEVVNSRSRNSEYFLYGKEDKYKLYVDDSNVEELLYLGIIEDEKLLNENIEVDSDDLLMFFREGYDFIYNSLLVENVIRDSQGDWTVIYTKKPLTQSQVSYIERIFFDQPFYLVVTVDGEDLFLDGEVDDIYDYDKDEIMEILKSRYKLSEYALKFIEENLPDYPKCL